jgi:hypothetical protein
MLTIKSSREREPDNDLHDDDDVDDDVYNRKKNFLA